MLDSFCEISMSFLVFHGRPHGVPLPLIPYNFSRPGAGSNLSIYLSSSLPPSPAPRHQVCAVTTPWPLQKGEGGIKPRDISCLLLSPRASPKPQSDEAGACNAARGQWQFHVLQLNPAAPTVCSSPVRENQKHLT